jgi:hypothetical protein
MHIKKKSKEGYALVTALALTLIYLVMIIGVMLLVSNEVNMCKRQYESTKAFFLVEAGIERAMASLRDTSTIPSTINFKLKDTGIINDYPGLDDVNIKVTSIDKGSYIYEVTSTAKVGNMTRKLKVNVRYNPPSKVFDYVYFINNWGWFYGSGITARGDVRSAGRFDFQDSPLVDGEVYAGQEIGGGDDVTGKAGEQENGEYIHQHPNSPIMEMPNLQDLEYYKTTAIEEGSTLKQGASILVNGVFGDDASESGNIVLIGTPSQPIEIDGPVVVTGDIVIKGTVKGQGTIYAGRNIYVAGNINYQNPPSSPRPASDDPEVVNQWVIDNQNKDTVGFAATENVILGDYTKSTHYGYGGSDLWYSNYWLFSMGNEDVGKDGIPDTDDEYEGDGTFQSEYEDVDGDGAYDDNYNWQDVETWANITNFSNLPVVDGKEIKYFSDLATNNIGKVEGVYYTNHAFAGRVGYGTIINGAIISKDEAIIYRDTITMNYDERIHSRYTTDPNWLIDLRLPYSEHTGIIAWWEE